MTKAFRRLRAAAADGNPHATAQLARHVAKWAARGARLDTVAKKLGLTEAQVIDLWRQWERSMWAAK